MKAIIQQRNVVRNISVEKSVGEVVVVVASFILHNLEHLDEDHPDSN